MNNPFMKSSTQKTAFIQHVYAPGTLLGTEIIKNIYKSRLCLQGCQHGFEPMTCIEKWVRVEYRTLRALDVLWYVDRNKCCKVA